MDSLYSKNKLNMPKGNVSTLMIPARGSFSPYSSQESLVKYLRSSSSSIGNISSGKGSFKSSVSPFSENTPVKLAEDDVLVVDGILVASDSGVGGSRSSSSSSGSGASHKTEMCRAWEDFGHCRFSSKCQFAHGKEELRPNRFPIRNKSETQMCKSYASTGSCIYGPKCHLIHPVIMETTAVISEMDSATSPAHNNQNPRATIKPEGSSSIPNPTVKSDSTCITASYSTYSTIKPKFCKSPISIKPEISPKMVTNVNNWSPVDDGIEVTLPSHPDKVPSRKETNMYIYKILYGLSTRRLPVFHEICLD
ncbi:hypothetical protein SLE2022_142730 [Rubroshorea leprosula]